MDYCLPCFSKSKSADGEHEPLLRKHRTENERSARSTEEEPEERSAVDKLVDVLAALNAGKLPTQKQFSHFLQLLLKSEFLKEDKSKAIFGAGPTSKQGRKVLGDVKGLVQAFLQFGLEKNDDDKLQELYFQVQHIDKVPFECALRAGQTAVDTAAHGAVDVKDQQSPIQDQLAFDASTLLSALRTLFETGLSSPVFRIALFDLFTIVKEIVAHAAADVGNAALQIQHATEDVEQQIRTDDIILIDAQGQPKLDKSVHELKNKGKEAVDATVHAVRNAKDELDSIGEEITDATKERILQRVQQVLERVQKDPASRSAMRAILILSRKYAERIAEVSAIAKEVIIDVTEKATDALSEAKSDPSPQSNGKPQPQDKKFFIDTTFDALLQNLKDILERIAKGYSLDGLLSAFERLVRSLNEVPTVIEDEINMIVDEKMAQSTAIDATSAPPSPVVVQHHVHAQPAKGKGKKNKKARAREKKALEKQASATLTPLTPSTSQEPSSPVEPEKTVERTASNPIRTYFTRLGIYLDRALEEPGWSTSKEGGKALESLFDDGKELINVVGESVLEVKEELVDEKTPRSISGSEMSTKEEEIRQRFKKDLTILLAEADAYVAEVESDKTTMQLFSALEALGDDLSELFFQTKKRRKSLVQNMVSMGSWTSWVGWAIPRILHMLPSSIIPIPSIEVKTGKYEAALHALFVQGLARGNSNPLDASFVPDSVVLKEWTEVKIDMADYEHSSSAKSSSDEAAVHTASRVRMHMDGVRAKVEGMGYYFKYTGGVVGYEDEGVLSVDVGMDAPHEGLGVDVELELESDNLPFDSGVDVPEIVVDTASDDSEPANADVQAFLTNRSESARHAAAAAPQAAPLFRVVDVQVAMRGLHFRIDKSRHWLLNKLVFQRLAGPVVAGLVRQALEERLRSVLGVVARGLGAVVGEAKRKGEERQEDEEMEESLGGVLSDWWRAVLEKGPMILGRELAAEHEQGGGTEVERRTEIDTTSKGIIYTSTSVTSEQPRGTPAMVVDPATGATERIDLPIQAIGGHIGDEHEEQTVVAIGDKAQLFPGKGGPYGEADSEADDRGVVEQVRGSVKETASDLANGLQKGVEGVENAEERWAKRSKAENKSKTRTWKSDAFDF